MPAAVVIAPVGTGGALGVLIERLSGSGIKVAVVDDLGGALEIVQRDPAQPPCVLIDLRDATGELEEVERAVDRVRQAVAAIPGAPPVCITSANNAGLVVACIRAGAVDVIDLKLEGTAGAKAVVQRVTQRQAERAKDRVRVQEIRDVVEDLMKALIRTERRTIDLEEQLAPRSPERSVVGPDARAPAVLLVEAERRLADALTDRLEANGIATFAYSTGIEAIRQTDELLGSGAGIDLALVAAELPGIDGLETVRRLQDRIRDLPAFLMTFDDDDDLADRAGELGIVGFVRKPVDDLHLVVVRLAELARESLHRTREAVYLTRIKERHERVLARYRSLPREP